MKKLMTVLVLAAMAASLNSASAGPVASHSKTLQSAKVGRVSIVQHIFDVFYCKPLCGLIIVVQ